MKHNTVKRAERSDGSGCLDPRWVIQSPVPLNTWLFSGITYDKWYKAVKGNERYVMLHVCVCPDIYRFSYEWTLIPQKDLAFILNMGRLT